MVVATLISIVKETRKVNNQHEKMSHTDSSDFIRSANNFLRDELLKQNTAASSLHNTKSITFSKSWKAKTQTLRKKVEEIIFEFRARSKNLFKKMVYFCS